MKKPAPKSPKLDQIELFPTKKRGGYRGGHRQKGAGSTVMRIPNDLVAAVTALVNAHKHHDLSSVTELKTAPETIPVAWLDKYINPTNTAQFWSGRGRIPGWVYPHMTDPRKSNIPDTLLNPNPTRPLNRSKT